MANPASITDATVVPFSIPSTERPKALTGVDWPTGTTKLNIGAPFKIVQDYDSPIHRGLALAKVDVKRRVVTLVSETNRGEYAATAGGPYRITRNLWTGGAGTVMGPGSFRREHCRTGSVSPPV